MRLTIRKWLAEWLRLHRHEPVRFRTELALRTPHPIQPDVVYQVGDHECVWAALLRCPCGCGDVIQLSLVRDARPSWRVQMHKDGKVSLMPSVWRTTGCKSHFIVYRSRLIWCLPEHDSSELWRTTDSGRGGFDRQSRVASNDE